MDLKLRRLQEIPITGTFTINCETNEYFCLVQSLFLTSHDYIRFKDIGLIPIRQSRVSPSFPYIPLHICGDKRLKFKIKYESLNELLKLREVFQVRANKFDTYLIQKRGYDPFTNDFYAKCDDPTIYKVRT